MKTTKTNPRSLRPAAFRMPCLLALLLCAGVSARASLAALKTDVNQSLATEQSQLSTGLKINSASDNPNAASPYTWLQAAPNVFSLNYNALRDASQQQTLLQLLQGGDPIQSAVSQLAQANQSQQSILQLFTGDNNQVTKVQQLQLADAQPQQVLKLLGASDNAAGLQILQQASAQSLSLANDQLQTADSSLQQLSQVQSAVNLVQANSLNQLSTGLRINQAADPAQLYVSTQTVW